MVQAELGVGTVLGGDFEILELLSSGGMGNVYVVKQRSTGSKRALKTMRAELLDTPRLRERFEQEARISGRIESDHIVQVLSAGVDEVTKVPYMVMELLEGDDLRHHVEARGGLPPAEVARIFDQLCHAISAAHAIGIVHRDIKPENIFLARGRSAHMTSLVKVLDFGVAKVIAEATSSGTAAVGTPIWMAPEQGEVRSSRIGPRTDVWALGLVAFHALTGKVYWLSAHDPKMSVATILRELLVDPLAPASERARALGAGEVPPGFDAWFARCVAREPGDRFESVALLEAELAAILGVAPNRVADKRAAAASALPRDTSPAAGADMSTQLFLEQVAEEVRAKAGGTGPASTDPASFSATLPAVPPAVPSTLPPPTERAPTELGADLDDDDAGHAPTSSESPKKRRKRSVDAHDAVVEARPLIPVPPAGVRSSRSGSSGDSRVPWIILTLLIALGVGGALWGLLAK